MKLYFIMGIIVLFVATIACQKSIPAKHIFFLHNRFLEEHHIDEEHPIYGKVEYREILNVFKRANFQVYSEERKGNVNARDYAREITRQIDSLLHAGVSPENITVVGTSKGGYIAQYVSTILQNPKLNYVFIACFRDHDIQLIPEINYCGNILTIYERTDTFGVSALARRSSSICDIKQFKEIELNTGLYHGFLFKADEVWMDPTITWAMGDYR